MNQSTTIYVVLNSLDKIIIKSVEDRSLGLPVARGILFCHGIRDTVEYWDSSLGDIVESKDKLDYCIVR